MPKVWLRGVALQVADEGGQVVMADRSEYVEEVLTEIQRTGGDAVTVNADLETYAGAQAVVAKAIEHYGRVDILINNVGGAIWMKPFEEFSEEEIIKEVNRSLFPTLWCCRAVLPAMIKQQAGVIVNVSSIATRGINRIPYSASKGGVNALTASLAFEHAKDGIRVNAVATGGTEAPPRKVPRNTNPLSQNEKDWMQQVVDQTKDRTFIPLWHNSRTSQCNFISCIRRSIVYNGVGHSGRRWRSGLTLIFLYIWINNMICMEAIRHGNPVQDIKNDWSISATVAGFLAVLISYSGTLIIFSKLLSVLMCPQI